MPKQNLYYWANFNPSTNISIHIHIICVLYWKILECGRLLKSFLVNCKDFKIHYSDVTMGTIASQITSLTIVYSTVYSGADQRKHQSSASLAFVRGIHRGPVNSLHKWPVTRKMFPFDDVIMLPKYFDRSIRGVNIRMIRIGSNLTDMYNFFFRFTSPSTPQSSNSALSTFNSAKPSGRWFLGITDRQHVLLFNNMYTKNKENTKIRITGTLCGGIHRSPVNFPHKGPVMRTAFP